MTLRIFAKVIKASQKHKKTCLTTDTCISYKTNSKGEKIEIILTTESLQDSFVAFIGGILDAWM